MLPEQIFSFFKIKSIIIIVVSVILFHFGLILSKLVPFLYVYFFI